MSSQSDSEIEEENFHSEIDHSLAYDVNANGNEIYKLSTFGHQMYRYNQTGPIYAKKSTGEFYYARDNLGNEQYGVSNNFNLNKAEWTRDVVFLDAFGRPVYRKNKNLKDIYGRDYSKMTPFFVYAKDWTGTEIYASVPYFIEDNWGNEIYAKNSNSDEYYFSTQVAHYFGGKPFYAKSKNAEIYPVDSNNKQIYAKRYYENNKNSLIIQEIYARDKIRRHVYAEYETGKFYFATIDLGNKKIRQYYALDQLGNDYYFGPEFAKDESGSFYYAEMIDGTHIYPNYLGDELVIYDFGVNRPKYATDKNYNEFYPKNRLGDEFYEFVNPTEKKNTWFAKKTSGKEFYCRDRTLNEFYPPDNRFIVYDYRYLYAKDKDEFVIFPKDAQLQEYYFNDENSYEHIFDEKIKRYVYRDNRFIYPTIETKYGTIEIVMGIYIKDNTDKSVFPRDDFNNEYSPIQLPIVQLPITNDGFEISSDENNPNIVKILFRSFKTTYHLESLSEYDYLTNVKSQRVPIQDEKKFTANYITAPYIPTNNNPKPPIDNLSINNNLQPEINYHNPNILKPSVLKSLWFFIFIIICLIGIALLKTFYFKV